MTKNIKKTNRVFSFATLEEEARFWDTHSTADYEGAFKPVQVRFDKKLSDMVMLRFGQKTLQMICTFPETIVAEESPDGRYVSYAYAQESWNSPGVPVDNPPSPNVDAGV
ncbi:MAG: hypothetical protein HY007_00055 [Candidatus Sungbacteria bacterium]|nr:hypothetical protein [Candidatus Sungbacteria bacterium]